MTDMARSIQSMLAKLTPDELDAFNFIVGLARQQPGVPRLYAVTWERRANANDWNAGVLNGVLEVWAYTRDEATEQAKQRLWQVKAAAILGQPFIVDVRPGTPPTEPERT